MSRGTHAPPAVALPGKSRRDLGLLGALLLATIALALTSLMTVQQEAARRKRLVIETYQAVAALLAGQMDESMRRVAAATQSAIEQEHRRRGALLPALQAIEDEHPWVRPLVLVGHEAAPSEVPAFSAFDIAHAAAERQEHQLKQPGQAASLYRKAATMASTAVERLRAMNGQARSELKAGHAANARRVYEAIISAAATLDREEVQWSVIAQSQLLECDKLVSDEQAGDAAVRLLRFVTEHRFIMDAGAFHHYRGLADRALTVAGPKVRQAAQQLALRNQQLDEIDRAIRKSIVTQPAGGLPGTSSNAVVIPIYAPDRGRIVGGVAYLLAERNLAALLTSLVEQRGPWSEMGVALVDRSGRSPMTTARAVPEDLRATRASLSAVPALFVATFPRANSFALLASRDVARYAAWLALVFCTVVGAFVLAARSIARELRLTRLRADFVASVSHELRTPLALIRMFGESLREGWVEDRQKNDYYEVITRESERLTGLINNVLDFSRLEAGSRVYQLVRVDLRAIVTELLDRYEFHLRAAHIELFRCLPDQPTYTPVDRDAIEQVIVNLLSNAVKYMGPERPTRQVTVALIEENLQVVLRVSDSGIGMSDNDRAHVFEQFYRADTDCVRAVPGSGLGLTLAKAHVVAHGGTIVVESILGEGSTFVITLPLAAATDC